VEVQVFDPYGQPDGVRMVTGPSINSLYTALGVDPSGDAVVAASLDYEDGGFDFMLVKLGP